ncbi:DUF3102 domain-containing protein [Nostoc sp. NIES-2111]
MSTNTPLHTIACSTIGDIFAFADAAGVPDERLAKALSVEVGSLAALRGQTELQAPVGFRRGIEKLQYEFSRRDTMSVAGRHGSEQAAVGTPRENKRTENLSPIASHSKNKNQTVVPATTKETDQAYVAAVPEPQFALEQVNEMAALKHASPAGVPVCPQSTPLDQDGDNFTAPNGAPDHSARISRRPPPVSDFSEPDTAQGASMLPVADVPTRDGEALEASSSPSLMCSAVPAEANDPPSLPDLHRVDQAMSEPSASGAGQRDENVSMSDPVDQQPKSTPTPKGEGPAHSVSQTRAAKRVAAASTAPPTTIRPPNFDPDRAADELKTLSANTTQNNLRMGKILIEAKEALPHGRFIPWLKSLDLSRSRASKAIQVAEMVGSKCLDSTHLPWESLTLIAQKWVPEHLRAELLARLLGPNPPKLREVKDAIRAAKAAETGAKVQRPEQDEFLAEARSTLGESGLNWLVESTGRIGSRKMTKVLAAEYARRNATTHERTAS